jgi:hypothetical protein
MNEGSDAMKMKPEIKQRWRESLLSGEFKQGRARLKVGDEYCCLGVLCELHRRETNGSWNASQGELNASTYAGNLLALPDVVKEWAGLVADNPTVEGIPLAAHNDGGKTFRQIADLIEQHL